MTPRSIHALLLVLLSLLSGACAITPPPIAVETPYGVVRAESEEKADEVAGLLSKFSPLVRAELPGTKDAPIDVWVQRVLRDSANGERGVGVKGFTLLSGEFRAKRIHLLEEGELSWYLSHELVHAHLDESWRTLPGVLEEGLADVVAERLNPELADRIRAHRLFTASGFFGGAAFRLAYQTVEERQWLETTVRVEASSKNTDVDVAQLVGLSRRGLRDEYREVPEEFYGLAYLLVDRIVARHELSGLYKLCRDAEAAGLEVIPPERLFEAAGIRPEEFEPELLASFFDSSEMRQLLMMQPDPFASAIASYFRQHLGDVSTRTLLFRVNPCLRAADGKPVSLIRVWPVRQKLVQRWRERSATSTAR